MGGGEKKSIHDGVSSTLPAHLRRALNKVFVVTCVYRLYGPKAIIASSFFRYDE
jgi:hypothetical protein